MGSGVVEARIAQLARSPLVWWWHSEFAHLGVPDSERLPRGLTKLDASSAAMLVADVLDHDQDDEGRFITLLGYARSIDTPDDSRLQSDLDVFVQGAGDLEVVIVQLGDTASDLAFVRRDARQTTSELLNAFGLSFATARRLPYERLRSARLETLFRLPERYAR